MQNACIYLTQMGHTLGLLGVSDFLAIVKKSHLICHHLHLFVIESIVCVTSQLLSVVCDRQTCVKVTCMYMLMYVTVPLAASLGEGQGPP